jgi:hypothetical protein
VRIYHFPLTRAVANEHQFQLDWHQQLSMNGFPPIEATPQGNAVTVEVESTSVPEAEIRKCLNFVLSRRNSRIEEPPSPSGEPDPPNAQSE